MDESTLTTLLAIEGIEDTKAIFELSNKPISGSHGTYLGITGYISGWLGDAIQLKEGIKQSLMFQASGPLAITVAV